MISIEVTDARGETRRQTFSTVSITIGRHEEKNELVLPDVRVTNKHARLAWDGSFILDDLGSTNGTWVNDRKITKPTTVDERDRIRIGPFSISVPRIQGVPDRQIDRLDQLHAYVHAGLRADLEQIKTLGDNESTFQANVFAALSKRLGEPFAPHFERNVRATSKVADIVIEHGGRLVAIEVKPTGALQKLLADARKLKGYLRRSKTSKVFLGVLVYRSPRPIPAELYKVISGAQGLVIVRVDG